MSAGILQTFGLHGGSLAGKPHAEKQRPNLGEKESAYDVRPESIVVRSVPIWAPALAFARIILGPQRRMAFRVARPYRTVSTQAVILVVPAHLQAAECNRSYSARKDEQLPPTKPEKRSLRCVSDRVSGSARRTGYGSGGGAMDNQDDRYNQLPCRLASYGSCVQYFHRIRKLGYPECHDCQASIDNAERAIFRCDPW